MKDYGLLDINNQRYCRLNPFVGLQAHKILFNHNVNHTIIFINGIIFKKGRDLLG